MEVGLHFIGYLLTFFFAFLYLPYLTFKFGAEYFVDLGRRRDSGEIEQFFAAITPSAILNGITFFWAWAAHAMKLCPWRVAVDYHVLAAALCNDEEVIKDFVLDGTRRPVLLFYVGILMLVAVGGGVLYGAAFRRVTAKPLLRDRTPKRRTDLKGWAKSLHAVWLIRVLWCIVVEVFCLVFYAVWHPLFKAEVIALFPWAVQKPWLFVRMHNARLYYGQFVRYDKSATGDVESITISGVRRYCYDEVNECLAAGRLPMSSFQGSLRISTDEITDMHNVPEDHFVHIQERYRKAMIKALGRDLLTAFAGRKQVRVDQIYAEHAGGTELSRYRYRIALRKLEELRFITITPPTTGEGSEIPVDEARVDFPNRVTTAYDLFVRSVPPMPHGAAHPASLPATP